jgi:hypothetical protein
MPTRRPFPAPACWALPVLIWKCAREGPRVFRQGHTIDLAAAPGQGACDLATSTGTMVGRMIRAWHGKRRRFEASKSRRPQATLGHRWTDPAKGGSLFSEVPCDDWGSPLP